jgi:DNA-binding transcriptional LysR family regulator
MDRQLSAKRHLIKSQMEFYSHVARNNGEVMRDAAVAGLGLVVLPTFIVGDAIRQGRLRPVLQSFALDDPSIHAIWPPNRQLSAKVRSFVDFLS